MIELTVFDDNGDKSPAFLGKVAIPLLSVSFLFLQVVLNVDSGSAEYVSL